MHGLFMVTWEKFISEKFGRTLLNTYRSTLGQNSATAPLVDHLYKDADFFNGISAASQLTGVSTNNLLREYGRYFILNGLTNHLCAYLLSRVHSGRDLVLAMRSAHAQMRLTEDGLMPPLFLYETLAANPNALTLIYDSPRQLCTLLIGAIEGAAERYGEQVSIVERTCMRRGAPVCRLDLYFRPAPQRLIESPEQQQRRHTQKRLADLVLTTLPRNVKTSITLAELQERVLGSVSRPKHVRPGTLLEALHHLQYAGLIMSTADQPGDNLTHRRYWRAPLLS